jgi:hypothetical protein
MTASAPTPLPADIDTLAKRDLVALCEERGFTVPARATADDLRETLRSRHRMAEAEYRREAHEAITAKWQVHHPRVEASAAAQVSRDALWGLANLFSRVQGYEDTLLYAVEDALPLMMAYLRDDERVSKADLRLQVDTLVREVENVRKHREGSADYAAFTMGDAARRVTTLREREEARRANRK